MAKAQRELERVQQLSADEFHHWQQRKAWEMVKFHFQNSDFYRAKIGNTLPDNWSDLPILTKQELQGKLLSQLIARTVKISDCYTGSTSGSSGVPLHFAKDKFCHAMTWALIANRYSWHNISLNDKQARFYGIPKDAKGRFTETLKDSMMNRKRFSVFNLSDEQLQHFVTLFARHQFRYIYGYTSALLLFAKYLAQQKLVLEDICPTLQLCISTSEMAGAADCKLLEAAFGVKHIREYGISETCITGFEDAKGNWNLTSETLLNEVVDENKLLSTSLYNHALPMIRYEVGDTIVLNEKPNGIYETIKELTGRTNDVIVLPGGKKAAGLTIYYVLKGIVENTLDIKEFVVKQTAVDKFIFEIVATRNLSEEEKNDIRSKAFSYLGDIVNIDIKQLDAIERQASGKHKLFHSEIDVR